MHNLFVNILRGIKKRLLQYFGIVMLLVVVISSLSALYSNAERLQSGFYTVENNSGKYDYRLNLSLLNNYKNFTTTTIEIKNIIKEEFKDFPDVAEINEQIAKIEEKDISNNTFSLLNKREINVNLKNYLLNWGVKYQSILVNEILNKGIYNNQTLQQYHFKKSFFKTFDFENVTNKQKKYYSYEDAFYFPNTLLPPSSLNFDYSPTRNNINKIYIVKGKKPSSVNEIVINPTFACQNGIRIDSDITIFKQTLKVVGFGYAYWGITGSSTRTNPNPKPTNTTPIYMARKNFNELLYNNSAYRNNLKDIFLLKLVNNDSYFAENLQEILIKNFSFNFGTIITSDKEDARSGQILKTFKMQNIIFSAITLVVLLVIVFIIIAYVRKDIDLQKAQLGLLKALGYKNFQIIFAFIFLIFLITFSSNILGLAIGLGLQILFNSLNNIGFFMPLPKLFFSLTVFLVGLILVPIIFIVVSYLQAAVKLHLGTLSLIYNRTSNTSSKIVAVFKYPFRYWPFKQRLAIAFTLKSVGKLFLVFFTFVFVSFLLLFQSTATDLFDNKINNLYGYINKDVKWYTSTASMYKYDENVISYNNELNIDKQLFDWISEMDIVKAKAPEKYHQLFATDFQLDSEEKKIRIIKALAEDNFKNYFIKSQEMEKLYQKTKEEKDCINFINPNHDTDPIIVKLTEVICKKIHLWFTFLIENTGIDPEKEAMPGISLGLNIYNNEYYYPSIETDLRPPQSWIDHNQDRLLSKKTKVLGLYNDATQKVAWKNWFYFKEQKHRDIDFIFNTSHKLSFETVTYINTQGEEKTASAYVIPAAISKALSILNNYKIDNKFLMLTNWYNYTIPIIFEVKGIIENNLDTSSVYVNLNDLRKAIGLIKNNVILANSFNYLLSKQEGWFPLNCVNLLQPDDKYNSKQIEDKNLLAINKVPFITDLIKKLLTKNFDGIRTIINITKFLTIIGVAFVLIIIVNMILDNNLLIIAMMKSLGYRVNEISRLIIGSYIIALVAAFILGTILSYIIWNVIIIIIATRAGTVFNLPISAVTIFSTFSLVFLVMIIGYGVGLYLIKYKPVTSLL